MYSWDFSTVLRNADVLLAAAWVTLALTAATALAGVLAALCVLLCRTSSAGPLRWVARGYIEVFRGLPVLVVLIWLFYALPIFFGGGLQFSPFVVALAGLVLNFSALEAEVLRAGYEAIPAAQVEAASALGMGRRDTFLHVVVPQVFWRSLAPTLGQVINTLKLTSLASFISVPELYYTAGSLIQESFRPLEYYTALAVLYLAIIVPPSVAVQTLEQRLAMRFQHE